MAISAGTALGLVESLDFCKYALLVLRKDKLCYAFAVVNHKILIGKVYQKHSEFAPIVGINGAGGVENCYAMLQRKTRTGTHLTLIACRKGYLQPCGNELALHRMQHYGSINISPYVHAGTLRSGIRRQLLTPYVNYIHFNHTSLYMLQKYYF